MDISMHKEQELSLLHITEQYVAEVQAGRQPRLSDYLARYPRYADAIVDFVAYYHAVEEGMSTTEVPPRSMDTMPATETPPHPTDAIPKGHTVNRVPTSHAINCPEEAMPSAEAALCPTDAIPKGHTVNRVPTSMATLLRTVTGQRLLPSHLAAELDLSVDIVLLLEQRAIAPVTIPHVVCERIAILLQQSSAVVQAYLGSLDQRQSGSAVQNSKQRMKVAEEGADYIALHIVDKPSFRAIVETSLQLSAEQRSRWCSLLDAEGR